MSIHIEEPNSVPDLPDSAQLNGNPLSRLFNKIRYDLGITPARVGLLVENYLNNGLPLSWALSGKSGTLLGSSI
jgi:hypothetical protein